VEVPLTPLDFLTRARRVFPRREGVVEGSRRWAYAEFADRCDRLAWVLRERVGVRPGDRVAWLCPNTHELLEAYYGVLLAGAVLLPLNVRLAPAELRFVLDDSGAVALFRHPDVADPGHGVPQVVLGDRYEALLAEAGGPAFPVDAPAVDESAPAELFYTSGTTGRPKGVVLTHRNLYLHAVHAALTLGFGGDDVVLHTIPLFHVNGWGTPHYLTGLGGVHVMLPRFDAADVLRLVEAERVTRLFLVPTMATMLLAEPSLGRRDLSSLRQVSVGGAPIPPAVLGELEDRLGCECLCGYGLTESSPQLTKAMDKPGEPPSRARRATTGLPLVGVDLRVLDGADCEVPWDGTTVGEICVRSNHVMAGYWERPEETAEALRGGWLRTGDLAVVDGDGYVTIVDRRKDLIVSGGENVSSVEVEKALAAHPAVAEAAVVGVPDERWGEVPKAWVVLRAGASASADELAGFVRERLAGFKVPRHVALVDELPKGGTGKVQKAELRRRG
jgi:fatty-acyl-CoA synthase